MQRSLAALSFGAHRRNHQAVLMAAAGHSGQPEAETEASPRCFGIMPLPQLLAVCMQCSSAELAPGARRCSRWVELMVVVEHHLEHYPAEHHLVDRKDLMLHQLKLFLLVRRGGRRKRGGSWGVACGMWCCWGRRRRGPSGV